VNAHHQIPQHHDNVVPIKKHARDKPKFSYYNWDKISSFNGTYNFMVGARGVGKTYGWKFKAIRNAIRKGEQFMYVRRYKDELKVSKETFFADIFHVFPDWDFRSLGATAQMASASTRDDKKRPWKIIGHFIALSTAQSIKSVAYPLVTNIGFDEFILEKGTTHYIANEVHAFNNLYSTVDRNKDKTRVFFMANAVSIMNPYFLEYDIKPDQGGEFVVKRDGFIVVHFIEAADFREQVYQTKFGKFIAGTEYGDFAAGNEFADNNDNLLNIKNASARYTYTIETKQGIFSIWIDWMEGKYYVQEKRPKQEILFTILPERMSEGKTLLSYTDKILQSLRTAFRQGNAYFDTPKSRNAFIEIFKR
jgi:hypothetical protein